MRLFVAIFAALSVAHAATTVKLAVLVPEATTWGTALKNFAKEAQAATNGEVQFKIYYGGVSGDEPDVLRKIRVVQMGGGIFTGKTLGDIHGDARVLELPFTFQQDRAKAMATLQKLAPRFDAGLAKKGFVNLGYFEVGQVYIVSTKKIDSLAALRGVKVWAWEGDELVKAMIEAVGLVSVPLAITDVLSSLSTGIIDAAYAPPLGLIALQWHSKVKYLVDFPTAWSMGALLVSQKEWGKIPAAHQAKLLALARQHVERANARTVQENEEARGILKQAGVQFLPFPASDAAQADGFRQKAIAKLKGKLFSAEILEALEAGR